MKKILKLLLSVSIVALCTSCDPGDVDSFIDSFYDGYYRAPEQDDSQQNTDAVYEDNNSDNTK